MAHRDKLRNYNAPATMLIGGETISKIVVRYAYRCSECLSELKYHNSGLACAANVAHQGFIHKKEVPATQAAREAEATEIEANYEIVDGLLRPKRRLFNDH